ncbi:MAG: thiamine pyrophosphate-dependent enzyme [Microthrixaceae bacterium]|nr:thiamine pyrophosphate-dependent enzyme [Microthrixaceae bacterium]
MQFALPDMGVRREDTVIVGRIGCAARFPYYMNTYGIHGIHGRAPAMRPGGACQPDLSVFVVGGDGDLLSIGGNHLLHALRRNVNITILLFNNRIYGLTKGQYSPTSEQGKGDQELAPGLRGAPLLPLSVALGVDATFVARTHDMDRKHMEEVFKRAHAHQGAAFVEVLQNCNVFNNHAYQQITSRDTRQDMLIPLVQGEPIRFGPDGSKGVVLDPKHGAVVVDVADVGEDALLVHNEARDHPSVAFALSRLSPNMDEPTPMGVFRAVDKPVYGARNPVPERPPGRELISELLHSGSTWTIE